MKKNRVCGEDYKKLTNELYEFIDKIEGYNKEISELAEECEEEEEMDR